MNEKKTKKTKDTRCRNFWSVVYPDSSPKNWHELIEELRIPTFISPLHDHDFNADNTPKKPHYHVMLMFEGVKSDEQIKQIFDTFGGVYHPDPEGFKRINRINSIRTSARYLIHLDNPDKYQYDISSVECLGGADYLSICSLAQDKYFAIQEMMAFCKCNKIVAFSQLLDYASINKFDWFRCLCDNSAIVMREYLKSLSWVLQAEDLKTKDLVQEGENIL